MGISRGVGEVNQSKEPFVGVGDQTKNILLGGGELWIFSVSVYNVTVTNFGSKGWDFKCYCPIFY